MHPVIEATVYIIGAKDIPTGTVFQQQSREYQHADDEDPRGFIKGMALQERLGAPMCLNNLGQQLVKAI